MLKNIKKYKKLFALVLLFLFCVSLFTVILPKEVRGVGPFRSPGAGKLIELGLDLLGLEPSDIAIAAAKFINYLIGLIAGFLFWLGAQIIVFFLSLNAKVVQLPAVEIGWSIARDIANLGFVLAIIIIAMATITRFESYGAKKLLPKLIAAAILVNFSLTIGSVFVDFSNVLSNFFIRKSVGGEVNISKFADSFAAAFNIQSFMQTKGGGDTGSVSISGELYNSLGAILSIFIAAVFTFIAALTLLGIALMLLVRLIYLAVLLIISPIAWLFWVIPSLEGEFKKWWTNFLHWIFYAPILTFFLYLALASIMKIREFTGSYSTTAALSGSGVKENMTLTKDVFSAIANMVVLVGLLVAGLITARSMGMVGAKGMIGIAEKAGQGARKWAGKKTGEAAKGVGRRIATAGTDEEGKTGLERLSAKYGHIPLAGRVLRGASGISSKAKTEGKGLVEEEYKKIESRTGEDAVNAIKSEKIMSDAKLAAWGTHAIKEGKWDKLTSAEQRKIIGSLRRTNSGEKVVEYAPHLAGEFVKPADRKKAEAKAAAKMTEIPKNMGVNGTEFANFLERNAQHIPSQMIEKIGTMEGKEGDNARTALKNTYLNQTSAINFTANNNIYSGYSGIKTAREDINKKSGVIETLSSKVKSIRAEMETKIANAVTNSEKEVIRRQYSGVIESETKDIQKLIQEKTNLKNELENVLKTQNREISKSIDRLDKIDKDPNYQP